MRLGVTNLDISSGRFDGIERAVEKTLTHPKFKSPAAYFDVGIAVAGYNFWKEILEPSKSHGLIVKGEDLQPRGCRLEF